MFNKLSVFALYIDVLLPDVLASHKLVGQIKSQVIYLQLSPSQLTHHDLKIVLF